MNGNQLLNKFSDVDPRLITGAENVKKKSRKGLFIGIGSGLAATAAALALVIGLNTVKEPVIDFGKYSHLPVISTKNGSTAAMGGGMGGIDLNEYSATNEEIERMKEGLIDEWKEASQYGYGEFETLPIYLSHSTDPDMDKIKAHLLDVMAKLGYSEGDLEFEINPPGDPDEYRKIVEDWGVPQEEIDAVVERMMRQTSSMAHIIARNEDIEFMITTGFDVDISFKKAKPLPDGCSLDYTAPDEKIGKAVDYLYNEYKALADYDKIVRTKNEIHDSSSFAASKLNYIEFLGDEAGYDRIRIHSADGCEKLGDYPILTAKAAEAELRSENVPEENRIPEGGEVIGVTFTYPGNYLGYTGLIPYYLFCVETGEKDGMVTYRNYMIYAVPERFIDMDTENYGVAA